MMSRTPPASVRLLRTLGATCGFQAKSTCPVWTALTAVGASPPPFKSILANQGAFGSRNLSFATYATWSPETNSVTTYGPVPIGFWLYGHCVTTAQSFRMCCGRTAPALPTKGRYQTGVGAAKVSLTVVLSTAVASLTKSSCVV